MNSHLDVGGKMDLYTKKKIFFLPIVRLLLVFHHHLLIRPMMFRIAFLVVVAINVVLQV